MNFADPVPEGIPITNPRFMNNANNLNKLLRDLSDSSLKTRMNLSDKLLTKVRQMIDSLTGKEEYGRQALFAYRGAVFKEIDSISLNKSQLSFTQNHFRILSALYGVLQPFDSIEEYRLDMKTKLQTSETSNLYDYWKRPLTDYFNGIENSKIIVNLASAEFSRMINFSLLKTRAIDIVFGEMKGNILKSPPMYSKMARGKLAGYIIRQKITKPEQIKLFNLDGYTFNMEFSSDIKFVFTR